MPTAGPPRAMSRTWVVIMKSVSGSRFDQLPQTEARDLPLLLGRDVQLLGRIMPQTPSRSDEHLVRGLAGGADDVDVAEARLVVAVRVREAPHRLVLRARRPGLLLLGPTSRRAIAAYPTRPARLADPRVCRERLEPIGASSARQISSAAVSGVNARETAAAAPSLAPSARSRSSADSAPARRLDVQRIELQRCVSGRSACPNRRSRAMPPSGKIFKRTCVTSPPSRTSSSKTCRVCGCSGVRGSSSRHAAPSIGRARVERVATLDAARCPARCP